MLPPPRQTKRLFWAACLALGFLLALWFAPARAQAPAPPAAPAELVERGQAWYQQGDYTQAATSWAAAARLYDERGAAAARGRALAYLALAQQQLGNWAAAETAIATSLDVLASPAGDSRSYAQALTTRGQLDFARGDFRAARDAWERAERLYTQLDDATGTLGSQLNQAQALEALGFHRQTCRLLLASAGIPGDCTFAPNKPDKFETVLAQFAASPPLQTLGLRSLGNVLRLLGDLEHSAAAFERALAVAPDPAAQLGAGVTAFARYERARALTETADTADRRLLQEEALAAASQARTQLQSASRADAPLTGARAQVALLQLARDLGQWEAARTLRWPAAAITEEIARARLRLDTLPPSQSAVLLRLEFAEAIAAFARPPFALDELGRTGPLALTEAALADARTLGDPRSESLALGSLGRLYEGDRQWERAAAATQQAVAIAQQERLADLAYRWHWQLGRVYLQLAQPGRARQAYEAATQNLEAVRRDAVALDTDQLSFREQIEPLYREYIDLLLREPVAADLRRALAAIGEFRQIELEDFLRCDLSPALQPEPRADPRTAYVSAIILGDRVAAIWQFPDRDELTYHATAIDAERARDLLRALRYNLELLYPNPEALQGAREVYRWLIEPVAADLAAAGVDTLAFTLDGALRNIPMAALYDGERYLIESYAVAVLPNRQLLQPTAPAGRRRRALAFGLARPRPEEVPAHASFEPLPFVPVELAAIDARLPSRTYLDSEFTQSALRTAVDRQERFVLHLATHGQFSSRAAETFLLTWNGRLDTLEFAETLNSAPADAIDLLVLSACETAAGDLRAALGLAGIAVQSGARSTIASLWSLDDRVAAQVVDALYAQLEIEGISKARALQQAQLQLLRSADVRTQSPRFWSALILVGDWL